MKPTARQRIATRMATAVAASRCRAVRSGRVSDCCRLASEPVEPPRWSSAMAGRAGGATGPPSAFSADSCLRVVLTSPTYIHAPASQLVHRNGVPVVLSARPHRPYSPIGRMACGLSAEVLDAARQGWRPRALTRAAYGALQRVRHTASGQSGEPRRWAQMRWLGRHGHRPAIDDRAQDHE